MKSIENFDWGTRRLRRFLIIVYLLIWFTGIVIGTAWLFTRQDPKYLHEEWWIVLLAGVFLFGCVSGLVIFILLHATCYGAQIVQSVILRGSVFDRLLKVRFIAINQSENDPTIELDPESITFAYIAVTHSDLAHLNSASRQIADFNRVCQPLLWNVQFKVKFVAFAVESDSNGLPKLSAIPGALKAAGLRGRCSIVANILNVSFDHGETESFIFAGFTFRDWNPKLITPRNNGIVPC